MEELMNKFAALNTAFDSSRAETKFWQEAAIKVRDEKRIVEAKLAVERERKKEI